MSIVGGGDRNSSTGNRLDPSSVSGERDRTSSGQMYNAQGHIVPGSNALASSGHTLLHPRHRTPAPPPAGGDGGGGGGGSGGGGGGHVLRRDSAVPFGAMRDSIPLPAEFSIGSVPVSSKGSAKRLEVGTGAGAGPGMAMSDVFASTTAPSWAQFPGEDSTL